MVEEFLGTVPNDGYTEQGYIAARPGLHPAVRFRYRPSTQEEWAALQTEIAGAKKGQGVALNARYIARKLVAWDLKDDKGDLVPRSATQVARLKPALFEVLYGIVIGMIPSDRDPDEQKTQEQGEQSTAELLAAFDAEQSVAEVRQANDEKN